MSEKENTITLNFNQRAMEILEGTVKIEGFASVEDFALKAISCYVSAYVETYDSDYLDELFSESQEKTGEEVEV